MNPIAKRLLITGIATIAVLVIGTFGYWYLTDQTQDPFDCFYMTVITITTIGYSEIIDLENHKGARLFTIFLAFSGIGLLTYFVSTVSALIIEGHLKESYKKRRMDKEIGKLEGHYIICGVSNHSFHLIEELNNTERKNVFVEVDNSVIHQVIKKFPSQYYIEGDATNDDVLIKAGIIKAKGLFAATNQDNLNLVISLSARRLNPEIKIVSLCVNHANMDKIKLAGADIVVSANYIGGLRMVSEMVRPAVTSFLDEMLKDKDKNLRIEQIDLNNNLKGKMISDLNVNSLKHTLLIALKTNNTLIFKPEDNTEIKAGDSLIVMTSPEDREMLEKFN
ncbi:MAG: NAD-binding protein [Ignavibacteria bacterium]